MAPSHVQCPSRDGQQNPCSWLITVTGQHNRVTTHKTSACRLQWVGPIHPCTPRMGLLGYLHSLHSSGSVYSGAESCVVPEGQGERLHVGKILPSMDPAFPPHRKGDQEHTGCSGWDRVSLYLQGKDGKRRAWAGLCRKLNVIQESTFLTLGIWIVNQS